MSVTPYHPYRRAWELGRQIGEEWRDFRHRQRQAQWDMDVASGVEHNRPVRQNLHHKFARMEVDVVGPSAKHVDASLGLFQQFKKRSHVFGSSKDNLIRTLKMNRAYCLYRWQSLKNYYWTDVTTGAKTVQSRGSYPLDYYQTAVTSLATTPQWWDASPTTGTLTDMALPMYAIDLTSFPGAYDGVTAKALVPMYRLHRFSNSAATASLKDCYRWKPEYATNADSTGALLAQTFLPENINGSVSTFCPYYEHLSSDIKMLFYGAYKAPVRVKFSICQFLCDHFGPQRVTIGNCQSIGLALANLVKPTVYDNDWVYDPMNVIPATTVTGALISQEDVDAHLYWTWYWAQRSGNPLHVTKPMFSKGFKPWRKTHETEVVIGQDASTNPDTMNLQVQENILWKNSRIYTNRVAPGDLNVATDESIFTKTGQSTGAVTANNLGYSITNTSAVNNMNNDRATGRWLIIESDCFPTPTVDPTNHDALDIYNIQPSFDIVIRNSFNVPLNRLS